MNSFITFLNSPIGVALCIFLAVMAIRLLDKYGGKRGKKIARILKWCINYVEKGIDDYCDDPRLKKADRALKMFEDKWKETENETIDDATKREARLMLEEIVHEMNNKRKNGNEVTDNE